LNLETNYRTFAVRIVWEMSEGISHRVKKKRWFINMPDSRVVIAIHNINVTTQILQISILAQKNKLDI